MKYRFAEFEIDCNLFELRKEDDSIHVEPKVFALLQYLAENPEKVISQDELIDTVWNGRIVSDAAVMTAIANARKALGDSGSKQNFIKTVRGRGIRFTAEVSHVVDNSNENTVTEGSVIETPAIVTQQEASADPVMLIVPFRTTGPDMPAKEFVQSLCSSLEIVLTRIPLLKMKSYSLLSMTSGDNASEIIAQSGSDYVLEGSVQLQGDHLVIQGQLTDTKNGVQLWAEQFKVNGDYISALEPSVVLLIKKLEPQLHRAMYDRATQFAGNKDSRLLYLEASGLLALKGWHHDSFTEAAHLLRASRESDPNFVHAPSYLSLVLSLGLRLGLLNADSATIDEAIDAAESALSIDAMDSRVLGLVGCAFGDLGKPDRALPMLRNAVELNQQNAQAISALGAVLLTTRQLDGAISHLSEGIRISPLDSRLSIWGGLLSTALRFKGDMKKALEEAELACQRDYRAYMPRVILAGTHLEMGRSDLASSAVQEAIRINDSLNAKQIYSVLGKRLGAEVTKLL